MKTKLMIALMVTLVCGISASADLRPIASRDIDGPVASEAAIPAGSFITGVNYATALQDGADYLQGMQADITEDNAGNGDPDSPDDPDDGGWDWVSTIFSHSINASSTNLYGATAQGLYYAYLDSADAEHLVALTDAATFMAADAGIRSAADLIFLMNYAALVSDTSFADAAQTKYDARITTYGTAQALAEYIRDVRASQGYENGIIAWDIGAWARAAGMLHVLYPGNGYDTDAVAIAEVIYQDSFMDNPGYFDIVDDAGWDPTYSDYNFYWYNLGITGLIDAFDAAGTHTAEIPGLVAILMEGQCASGGMSFSYGGNTDDEDWQSSGYAMMTLGRLDDLRASWQPAINLMGDWIVATQDGSGGWVYGSGNHYPEVCGENTAGLYFTDNAAPVIPAVSEWGLVIMTLLGFVVVAVFYGRHRVGAKSAA